MDGLAAAAQVAAAGLGRQQPQQQVPQQQQQQQGGPQVPPQQHARFAPGVGGQANANVGGPPIVGGLPAPFPGLLPKTVHTARPYREWYSDAY
jgi:hypothetical protein